MLSDVIPWTAGHIKSVQRSPLFNIIKASAMSVGNYVHKVSPSSHVPNFLMVTICCRGTVQFTKNRCLSHSIFGVTGPVLLVLWSGLLLHPADECTGLECLGKHSDDSYFSCLYFSFDSYSAVTVNNYQQPLFVTKVERFVA